MYNIFSKLQPGISPNLNIPPRITESVIPSHDPYKKVCPFSHDSGITMQIKYEATQNYPNCIFGNRYRMKYPKLEDSIKKGLSIYKLNNRLTTVEIDKSVLNVVENLENPYTWIPHINNYKQKFTNHTDGWKRYCEIRGNTNSELTCKLFGAVYNNPLDLFDLIVEEMKKKSGHNTTTTTSSTSSSSSSSSSSTSSNTEVNQQEQVNEAEVERESDQELDGVGGEEQEDEEEGSEKLDQGNTKTSGGKCMDLLKALYRFIYSVSLQAWALVRNRFLARQNHDQSRYEYIFFLVPKDDIKDVSFILNANTVDINKNSKENLVGVECIKRFNEVMLETRMFAVREKNPDDVVNYIRSVSASEFVACSLRYIIDILIQKSIVTEQTAVEQRKYAISITNVCMLNSVTIAGMQSIPINEDFIIDYNISMSEKLGNPDMTAYVDQQFSKHFQHTFKVFGIKRLKHKNEFAFPVFISGIFFTPDKPLNRVCTQHNTSNDKSVLVSTVTRSYFTYGAYFTPNSHVTCNLPPLQDTFPSYLARRCSHWYSIDKKSCLMYLSSYQPADDLDPYMHDLDLCAVSELEWSNCIKNMKVNVSVSQLSSVLFDKSGVVYRTRFWPLEYIALSSIDARETKWEQISTKFYILYLALTKVICDDILVQALNIEEYKANDHIIMYILYHSFEWKSLAACIDTLRAGRNMYNHFLTKDNKKEYRDTETWNAFSLETEVQQHLAPHIQINVTEDIQLPAHDVNELIHVCMLYMNGNDSYKNSRIYPAYTNYDVFKVQFGNISQPKTEGIKTLLNYANFYNLPTCQLDQDRTTLVIDSIQLLIEWISLYIIVYFLAFRANAYFMLNAHSRYRVIKEEAPFISVDEVRQCLSFPLTNENKKVLNLESIIQAYSLLAQSNLSRIECRPEEYIILLNCRNILILSDKPEFNNPDYLEVLDNVLKKLYVRNLPETKRRKLHHVPSPDTTDDTDDTRNTTVKLETSSSSSSSSNTSSLYFDLFDF